MHGIKIHFIVSYPGDQKIRFIFMFFFNLATPSRFAVTLINSTAVLASWSTVESPYLDHYTIYYHLDHGEGEQEVTFPAEATSGMIGRLTERKDYLFSISVTYAINGTWFEGERTDPVSGEENAYYCRRSCMHTFIHT